MITGPEPHLLRAAQQRDVAAWGSLVQQYQRYAYAIARAIVTNHADAEDVVQTAWLRAFRALPLRAVVDAPSFHFPAWLGQIVRNAAIDDVRWRTVRRGSSETPAVESLETSDGPEEPQLPHMEPERDPAELGELRQRLRAALQTLPLRMRSIVVLHAVYGFTHAELGQLFGCPTGTARSELSHGRRRLRQLLQDLAADAQYSRICA